jgi:hypothetical protein
MEAVVWACERDLEASTHLDDDPSAASVLGAFVPV